MKNIQNNFLKENYKHDRSSGSGASVEAPARKAKRIAQDNSYAGFSWCAPSPVLGRSREESAFFIGVSPSKFDAMVKDGRMPAPKKIDGRRIWDIRQLQKCFDQLPGGDDFMDNPWDEVVE